MRADLRRQVDRARDSLFDLFTGWPLHIATAVFVIIVVSIAPKQFGLLAYKAASILLGAIGAYWINRAIFHRHASCKEVHAQWQLVVMICAAMLAFGFAA